MTMTTRNNADATARHTTMPEAWVVRGEVEGADEEFNIREGIASVHWNGCPNPFTQPFEDVDAYARDIRQPNAGRQIWAFAHDIPIGSLIVMPRLQAKHHDKVAIGWCIGKPFRASHAPYEEPWLRLPVRWEVIDMPRARFSEATNTRFNSPHSTVSRIQSAEVVMEILRQLPSSGGSKASAQASSDVRP